MPSLVYYGLDSVDNIPSTIPLTDREFSITKAWTFFKIIVDNIEINENMSIKGDASVAGSLTVNDLVTTNNNLWVKGDLYVNSTSMNQSTVNENGQIINNGGNIYAGEIMGLSFAARYRDLAERFEADKPIPKGSLVAFGGEKEITLATKETGVNAIVAMQPALKMNEESGTDETHPFITWCGRVPCRVIGKIKKFDKLTLSSIPGVATASHSNSNLNNIAIALEDYDSDDEGLIEVITQAKLF